MPTRACIYRDLYLLTSHVRRDLHRRRPGQVRKKNRIAILGNAMLSISKPHTQATESKFEVLAESED